MAATAVPLRSRRRPRGRSVRRVGDERLVARVRAGDDDAFEAIYDRYYLGLLAFCRHMLGSRHEAEDALQHSFASAYRALRAGNSAVDLRPWLYTIARNRCLSALRSRREELDIDGVDVASGSFEGLPLQIQLRAELREIVADLRRLPDDQRAALVLFELGDHSHDEIAAVLGVRREKVKALVFQARSGLLRARRARNASCAEVREQIASLVRGLPKRGLVRAHVDRCEACAEFEREVRRQRSALAAILPVVPSAGLKATVLGFALGGGGGAAALTGATAGGGVAVGGAAALGTAGVATVAGGIVSGTTNVGSGLGALSAKGLMTKLLTVVAVAGGGGEARHPAPQVVARAPAAVTTARDSVAVGASEALTARRQADARHVSHAQRVRRPSHGPADPSLPLSVPAPESTQADVMPALPAPAPQRPTVLPAVPAAAPTPTPAADPAPAPAPAASDPAPTPEAAPAATDPAPAPASTTSTTASTTTAESTPTAAPDATATTSTDASATTTTLSATDPPPAPSAPAAAAADAQS
jgi:RNA polymerase sigma factor (sigma-70 family)